MDPLLSTLGTQITRATAHSALPGAPVVSEDATSSTRRLRAALGRGLHAVARRVEPATVGQPAHYRTA